jgi:hypothetical protein
MRKELCLVGSVDKPYGAGNPSECYYGARFARFEFKTDCTSASSLAFPCGILMELGVRDGLVLAAIARTQISAEEMAFVNQDTWGYVFRDASTYSFFERRLAEIKYTVQYPDKGYLYDLCRVYTIRSALRTLNILEVPSEIMLACGLTSPADLTRSDGYAKLDLLAEWLANEPFFSEYSFPH